MAPDSNWEQHHDLRRTDIVAAKPGEINPKVIEGAAMNAFHGTDEKAERLTLRSPD